MNFILIPIIILAIAFGKTASQGISAAIVKNDSKSNMFSRNLPLWIHIGVEIGRIFFYIYLYENFVR